ncbi:MAG TPA: PilW family protein [Coxiellaceae bacterium]|nr:PilW family protein [Coxiellaceae bacterium]
MESKNTPSTSDYCCHRLKKSKGFSLLELLMASAIGLLVLSGLLHCVQNIQRTEIIREVIQSIQVRGEHTTELLTQRIRLAGFAGCGLSGLAVDQTNAIRVYAYSQIPEGFRQSLASDSDVLVLGQCLPDNGHEVFMRMAYFIAPTQDTLPNGRPIYALYAKRLPQGRSEELVRGITHLHFQLGMEDARGNNIARYLSPSAVTQWVAVKSVSVQFQVESLQPVLSKTLFSWWDSMNESKIPAKNWGTYIMLRERSGSP